MSKMLIVVDVQNDFVDGSLGTPEAVSIIPNVVNKINELGRGDVIIFTRDTHDANKYLNTQEGKNLPVLHCIKDTAGWQINSDVENAAKKSPAKVIYRDKPSFGSTELINDMNMMYSIYTSEIEVIGLCTDICVVSNALIIKAFFPEDKITVDSSCCAGVTPEKHEAALETMRSCQINVI